MKKTILTGLRPTGNLHLGHLFGAGKNYVKLQDEYNFFLEIADVQALTDNYNNPEKVRDNVYELTKDLLSIGINPEKANIFIQSKIKEIAEITVFYSNLVTIARLQRNPTIKSEIASKKELFGENGESITYGFLGYPVSQAADITTFNGEVVPVGEDQLPLLEQCREIVRKFNSIYGDTLVEPEAVLSTYPRVKGLDGSEKMGKSLGNALFLTDDTTTVTKKIMSAVTDPDKIKKDDKANPNKCMVYYYHKLLNNDLNKDLSIIETECKNGSRGCVNCKKELINSTEEFLTPIREKRKYYDENPSIVNDILDKGTKKAQEQATIQINKIKQAMKIDY